MNAWVKIHIEKFIGAIPISIIEAVHGQSTRVLKIPIAVQLENIAIGIIPESFGIVSVVPVLDWLQLPLYEPEAVPNTCCRVLSRRLS
jgi:hypothetical protein